MPELPEVESARYLIEKICLSSTIKEINTSEQGGGPRDSEFDNIVYDCTDGKTEQDFVNHLKDTRLHSVKRKGKQLWFELADMKTKKVWK